MGGQGSGRPRNAEKHLTSNWDAMQKQSEELFIPNLSGVQNEIKEGTHNITTDDLTEGTTNKYYKDSYEFWQRVGTTLSPKNTGDNIETTGTLNSGYLEAYKTDFTSGTDTATINARFPTTNVSTIGSMAMGKFGGGNNGVGLRFQQVEGTDRLVFRGSSSPGAMVWAQPESGAVLVLDFAGSRQFRFKSTDFAPMTTSINLGQSSYPWDICYFNTGRFYNSINAQGDNVELFFGAASDASITYDGSNMVINPQEVGSGQVTIEGDCQATKFKAISPTGYETVLLDLGRNTSETFQVSFHDSFVRLRHRNDSDSNGTHSTFFDIDNDSTGLDRWKWRTNGADWMNLQTDGTQANTNLNINGSLSIQGTTVNVANLPTSATGLATGDLWNNGGVLNIA